jgi:phage terminase Nu1 subunit (DNA packaging protein)
MTRENHNMEQQPALMQVGDPLMEPIGSAKLAEGYGVDIRTIQNWDEKGWIARKERGFYILGEVLKGVYDAQRELINKKKPETPEGMESSDEAERRKKIAEANIKELEESEKKRDLLPRSEVEKATFEMARQIREAFENIPSRVGDIVAAEADPVKVKQLLGAEINRVLENLSK